MQISNIQDIIWLLLVFKPIFKVMEQMQYVTPMNCTSAN